MTFTKDRLQIAQKLLIALVFASLFLSFTVPVFDPDFWWHLASGKWMWLNGTLLNGDPFTIESPFKGPSFISSFGLKQYWLSQIIFYAVYLVSGYIGIILLGAAVFTLMFYLIYRLMREAGAGRLLSLILLYISSMVIVREFGYIGIKPQMWTSLFAVVIVCCLEALHRGERWSRFAIPVLMLFWSNLHGGFIMGDAILVIYLAGALISRSLTRTQVVVILAAILASGINPNGFRVFFNAAIYVLAPVITRFNIPGILQIKEASDSISETQSIFSHASVMGIVRRLPFFSATILLSLGTFLLNLRNYRRIRPEFALLFLLVLMLGYRSIRYIIFFAAFAPLLIVVNLQTFRESFPGCKFSLPGKASALLVILIALGMGGRFAAIGYASTFIGRGELVSSEYQKGADFIAENHLRGNMFNDYNCGGYLIWRLSPDIKFFIDGRILYGKIFSIFRAVVDNPFEVHANYGNGPHYAFALNYFNINLVMIPGCDAVSGTLIKLAPALIEDPAWELVYDDQNVLIFMRNSPGNQPFLKNHALPKDRAYRNIFSLANNASHSSHSAMMANWKLSMAYAYAGVNDIPDALRLLNEYRQKVPEDSFAQELQAKLLNRTAKATP